MQTSRPPLYNVPRWCHLFFNFIEIAGMMPDTNKKKKKNKKIVQHIRVPIVLKKLSCSETNSSLLFIAMKTNNEIH